MNDKPASNAEYVELFNRLKDARDDSLVGRLAKEVTELRRALQQLVDAQPDTRKLLIAREDAKAVLGD